MPTPPPLPKAKSAFSGKVKGCLGCFGTIVVLFVGFFVVVAYQSYRTTMDFRENRTKIIGEMKGAAEAGNYRKVIEIGNSYSDAKDGEVQELLAASKKVEAAALAEQRQRASDARAKEEAIQRITERKRAEEKELQRKAEEEKRVAKKTAEEARSEKFKKWALENTAVTDIAINGVSMFVTLKPEKYTNRDNVRVIAEALARYYVIQSGIDYAACHVYLGNEEYAKGSYAR